MTDMGESARQINEQMMLRKQYDYLFAPERDRLEDRLADLEARHSALIDLSNKQQREIERLRTLAKYEGSKSTRKKGTRPQGRVRCIYWVTARMNGPAQPMLDTLWHERPKLTDEPESGLKVSAGSAEGDVLKIVVDYTVVGNAPADVRRMLEKTATRIGMVMLDDQIIEKSRVRAPEFTTNSQTG